MRALVASSTSLAKVKLRESIGESIEVVLHAEGVSVFGIRDFQTRVGEGYIEGECDLRVVGIDERH